MTETMLQPDVSTTQKGSVHYLIGEDGKPRRYKAWLGDWLAFMYDWIMERSVFPKKLGADMERHFQALQKLLNNVHGRRVLDLAAGSGSIVRCLPPDNQYCGTDISPGLLKRADTTLRGAGFHRPALYVTPADDLPFTNASFDLALCNLSLNFFSDLDPVLAELHRVLTKDGYIVCTVPVPERNQRRAQINGTMRSEAELREAALHHGMDMETLPVDNGAVLYFVLRK